MDNYPYSGDYMLEPPDDSVERDSLERRQVEAFEDYMRSGHLPGGHDSGTVDEVLFDTWPECLHQLQALCETGDGAEIAMMAAKICDHRRQIAIDIIEEELQP